MWQCQAARSWKSVLGVQPRTKFELAIAHTVVPVFRRLFRSTARAEAACLRTSPIRSIRLAANASSRLSCMPSMKRKSVLSNPATCAATTTSKNLCTNVERLSSVDILYHRSATVLSRLPASILVNSTPLLSQFVTRRVTATQGDVTAGFMSARISAARVTMRAPIAMARSSISKTGECSRGHSPAAPAQPRRNCAPGTWSR